MFTPEEFQETRQDVMVSAMQDIQFACVVTPADTGLVATHLPLVTRGDAGEIVLEGHFSRANPHWKLHHTKTPSLVIFQGSQAYVHPGWYPSKHEHGKAVPTWNYIVVHAHGTFETFDDPKELHAHLDELTWRNEAQRSEPWKTEDAPESYMSAMKRGIVGFRMKVSNLEGQWKLSQNKSEADFAGALAGIGEDFQPNAKSIAMAMAQTRSAD